MQSYRPRLRCACWVSVAWDEQPSRASSAGCGALSVATCTRTGGSQRCLDGLLWPLTSACACSSCAGTVQPVGGWQQRLGHLASPEPTRNSMWISQWQAARTLASVTRRAKSRAAWPVCVLVRQEFSLHFCAKGGPEFASARSIHSSNSATIREICVAKNGGTALPT